MSAVVFASSVNCSKGLNVNGLPVVAVQTVNVGMNPTSMAVNSAGTRAYVVNTNYLGLSFGADDADSVSVLDLATNLPITTVYDASFDGPYTVTLNADNSIAYVTNNNITTVSKINTTTNTVVGTITGFNGPSGMVITGNHAYVNNYGAGNSSGNGNTVSVVDIASNRITAFITLGPVAPPVAPAAIAIHGKNVYTINYVSGTPGSGTMSIIDTTLTYPSCVTTAVTGFITFAEGIQRFGEDAKKAPFMMQVNCAEFLERLPESRIGIVLNPGGDFGFELRSPAIQSLMASIRKARTN